jgi:ribonuclease HI
MGVETFQDPNCPRLFSSWQIGQSGCSAAQIFRLNNARTLYYLSHFGEYVYGVYVDGACPGNGQSWARGGYGVFFGPNSDSNVSKPLKDGTPQTSQRAELMATLVALHQIENFVSYNPDYHRLWVILTDSAYVVNSLTNYIYKWRENDYTASSGREVANRDLFERLDRKLDQMECGRQGIDVLFWKVDRSENQEADGLAKDGAAMG